MQQPKVKRRISLVLGDFRLQYLTRIKIIIRDKITVCAFLVSIFCFALILNTLNLWASDNVSIPVGLIDEDNTILSKKLVDNLDKLDSLLVNFGDFDELESKLIDGNISCIFVIKPGYETNIINGNIDNSIALYSGRDDKTAALLGDIVAGQMMYDISINKSYNKYLTLDEREFSKEEYFDYFDNVMANPNLQLNFDIKYVDVLRNEISNTKIDNSVLYRQVIASMVALLLSFVILFSFSQNVIEKEQGIARRRKATLSSKTACIFADNIATLSMTFVLCILVALSTANSVVKTLSNGRTDISFFSIFINILLICLSFVLVISIIMTILSSITKSLVSYQIIGSIILLIFGIAGFASIFSGFLPNAIQGIVKVIPNSLYIREFTYIIT